jgi:arsenate reductase
MAEGLFNADPPPGWRARSAGTEPKPALRPEAVAVMREVGVDISAHRPKALSEALGPDVALVVGLCAEEACPVVPGARSLHWPLPDPRPGDLDHMRELRDALRRRIAALRTALEAGAVAGDEVEAGGDAAGTGAGGGTEEDGERGR